MIYYTSISISSIHILQAEGQHTSSFSRSATMVHPCHRWGFLFPALSNSRRASGSDGNRKKVRRMYQGQSEAEKDRVGKWVTAWSLRTTETGWHHLGSTGLGWEDCEAGANVIGSNERCNWPWHRWSLTSRLCSEGRYTSELGACWPPSWKTIQEGRIHQLDDAIALDSYQ